jgi:hypothetical protein
MFCFRLENNEGKGVEWIWIQEADEDAEAS